MATSFSDNLKRQLTTADTLQRLLIVNVVLFIVIRLVNSLTQLYNTPLLDFEFVSKWLAVPAAPLVLLTKPWTLITYMFYHWDFMHLLFNMLWLFWMGRIFQEYLGSKKLLNTYIPVSYTHLRAHETVLDLVCRLLLEKKQTKQLQQHTLLFTKYSPLTVLRYIY